MEALDVVTMSGSGNPIIDNAQKALYDLWKAHHGDGDQMYGYLNTYSITSGSFSARRKQQAQALIMRLLASGHISSWAASQFQSYLDATPKITGGLAPASVKPSTIDSSLGASLANLPHTLDIGAFLSTLAQASTWIRVAEVVIGAVLIAVGVAQLTHAVPLATKIAKAVK